MSEAQEQYVPNWNMNEVLSYQRERAEQKRICDLEVARLRNIDKRAKEAGLPIEVIRAVDKIRKREKPEAEVYLNQFLRITAANGIVAGPQLNMWAVDGYTPTDDEKNLAEVAKAEDAGYSAGRGGQPKDSNPYQMGTEPSAAWVKWWGRGVDAQKQLTGGRSVVASREQPAARKRAQKPAQAPRKALPAPDKPLAGGNVVPLLKRGRGRPKGAKNKLKAKRG